MIKNYSDMNQTIQSGNAKGWLDKFETGQKIDFNDAELGELTNIDDGQSFGDFLTNSIAKVNDLQVKANTEMEKLATGKSQNLHETMLAVEQAQIAFKTMNQIRTKVIDAYKEIMKMQV